MQLSIDAISKWSKRSIAFISDLVFTGIALVSAQWLSNNFLWENNLFFFITILCLQCLIYFTCGLYRGIWRFASIPDLMRILRAVFLSITIIFIFAQYENLKFSANLYLAYALLLLPCLAGPRILYRWFRDYPHLFSQGKGKRVLVIGAGSAGEGIIRDLRRAPLNKKFLPIGLIDDDRRRRGCEVQGIRVLGRCEDITKICKQLKIELILIAIPSADSTTADESGDFSFINLTFS